MNILNLVNLRAFVVLWLKLLLPQMHQGFTKIMNLSG